MKTLPVALVTFAAAAAAADAGRIGYEEIIALMQNIKRIRTADDGPVDVDALALEIVKHNGDIVPMHKAQAVAEAALKCLPAIGELMNAIGVPTFFYQRAEDLQAAQAAGIVSPDAKPVPSGAVENSEPEINHFKNLRRKGPPVYADTPQPLPKKRTNPDGPQLGKDVLNEDDQA